MFNLVKSIKCKNSIIFLSYLVVIWLLFIFSWFSLFYWNKYTCFWCLLTIITVHFKLDRFGIHMQMLCRSSFVKCSPGFYRGWCISRDFQHNWNLSSNNPCVLPWHKKYRNTSFIRLLYSRWLSYEMIKNSNRQWWVQMYISHIYWKTSQVHKRWNQSDILWQPPMFCIPTYSTSLKSL